MATYSTPLSEWISQQLDRREMSQAEFSKEANIPKANVSYIMTKGHVPQHETLQRIADFFEVSVFYVYQLAGLLPTDINIRDADPSTIATLNEAARILGKMAPTARKQYLMAIRSLTAFVSEITVEEEIEA